VKTGDLVIRAYAYSGGIVSGIIVGAEKWNDVVGGTNIYPASEYEVLWSDGTHSLELYEELDYFEDVFKLLKEQDRKH
tara:strand:- start:237 stop:470 length:234 start_codon:yes stop_codon:yes gene_type:complete